MMCRRRWWRFGRVRFDARFRSREALPAAESTEFLMMAVMSRESTTLRDGIMVSAHTPTRGDWIYIPVHSQHSSQV